MVGPRVRPHGDGSSDGGSSNDTFAVEAAAAAAARTERLWADVPYQRLCRANSACLKKLLRTAGCPPGLRPDVWFHISSGAALAADAPPYSMLTRGGYSALARHRGHAPPPAAAPAEHPSAAPDALAATAEGVAAAVQAGRPIGRSSIRSAISGDAWIAIREETAPRCLPKALGDRVMALQGGPAALQRMLVAYAAYNPAPGALWPGIGAVAAFALVVMQDEEKAFWTLAGLANRLFSHCDGQGQLGCLIETQALTSLVRGKLPRIYTHLVKELEVTPSDLLGPWVSRCLVGAAGSIQATARCWDCLLFEGPKVLHRVALAILAMSESTILSCAHPMALARLLEGRVKGAAALCGEGVLISAAFRRSLVGSMPGAMLASLRVKAAADVERQLERKRAQLAQIISR